MVAKVRFCGVAVGGIGVQVGGGGGGGVAVGGGFWVGGRDVAGGSVGNGVNVGINVLVLVGVLVGVAVGVSVGSSVGVFVWVGVKVGVQVAGSDSAATVGVGGLGRSEEIRLALGLTKIKA